MKTSHRQNMPFERGWSHPAFLLLVAAVVAIATATGIVKADVLYDSTWMTDNESWDVDLTTFIGGQGVIGSIRDVQAADNFGLDQVYEITSVTADYIVVLGNPPDGGVLVEFFQDMGGTPTESPFAAKVSTAVTVTPIDFKGTTIFRLTVDLSRSAIVLAPGSWWVSITPVDETPGGDGFFQLGSAAGEFENDAHARDGGIDHGTGYPGFHGVSDWTLLHLIGAGNIEDRDLAMKIEGTPVKPVCPADFDNSGDVGVKDLLFLLGEWGPCPKQGECLADFDNTGDVDVKDLLFLLGAWGPCPL